jgi:excisionase family DNA binding protein
MLTVKEAARMAGRNPETVRRWIREGKLPARKFGHEHAIDDDDLGMFMKKAGLEVQAPPRATVDIAGLIREARDDRSTRISDVVTTYRAGVEEGRRATNEWLPAIVGRIVRLIDPVRIILFGSRARGTAASDSDYDLLVVLDRVDDRRGAAIAIRRTLSDLPISKDVVVTDRAHAQGETRPRGIVHWALAEGRVVYERP